MFPIPKSALTPNTYDYESSPLVKPTGFREYDARWLLEKEINLMGVQALGMGLGTLIKEMGVKPEIVTGHDFRSYSASVKMALVSGLMAAGCKVHDIGLCITPMAYFAQFELDVPCVAMVTASHNDNGWTGVKMGANRPLTFGPNEMKRLKDIVLEAKFTLSPAAPMSSSRIFRRATSPTSPSARKIKRKLKVVAACGNGTAGAFAPKVLEAIGCEVVPLDCELDHTFPRYNPNTEDMKMLHAMRDAVLINNADVALGVRRRRRPLRRGRQRRRGNLRRQGRRHAGARHVGLAQEFDLRGRREIDRPVHDRSGAEGQRRQGRLLEDRAFLHQAARQRTGRGRRLREVRPFLLQQAVRPRL